jgi:hypothetical protein
MVSDRVTELTHKLSDCSVVIKLSTGSAQKFENTIAKLNCKINVSLSFFVSWSDLFYLLIVSVEGYCYTWSHSMTHRHTR